MALARDQIPHDSSMGSKVQSCVFNENNEYHKSVLEEEDGSQSTNGFSNDSAITHSPPLCGNAYAYKATNYQLEEEQQSLIDFKGSCYNTLTQVASESLLNFEQNRMVPGNSYMKDDTNVWDNNLHHQWSQISPRSTSELRPVQDSSCFQSSSSSYSTIVNSAKEKQLHGESSSYGWFYSQQTIPAHSIQDPAVQEPISKKRISMQAEKMKAAKKQCTDESKMPKSNKLGASKDPQSVAAKNRRERISERLKILQELVPNGSKVDLVTMLEKAISYVKFLQLQVKVLAADEFWPVQGGKAPDISQVKEAIDAILSSQRSEKQVQQPQSR
ncbi:putative transcription factor bHLH086 [Arachis duranensis]|uniref:BHLH domain-containing protein n=2 Tax=Arachis TaxID=3817 RepID=A0A445DQF6_ARAHY|nr:putative transcription factor bHLH086 [Arachis duranensis]XP_025690315.1 putative transcription factor bHLH086 [Arachis hypogaea]QHO59097.1 Putative transcription factor [Arachis hypogaea]RYR65415.1 hypothetical protein Ahy_A03g011347 [Arachis hypogaea]